MPKPSLGGVKPSSYVYQTENGSNAVNASARHLRNDEGEWTCTSRNLFEGYGLSPNQPHRGNRHLRRAGGYEGLSAILVLDDSAGYPFSGRIFPGDFPPLPAPPAAE